jgi:hypothetical protein
MKRMLVTLAVLLGLFAAMFGAAVPTFAAGTTLSTDPKFVNAGDVFTVAIKINTDQQIIGWQADVSYNSALVTLATPAGSSWTEDATWLKAAALAAGGDTFRVSGTVSNAAPTGSLVGASVAGLGFPAGTGATGIGTLATLNFTAVSNGKAQLTFSNVCLVLPNNSCYAGTIVAPSYIQVGPAPQLQVSAITFTPTGAAGQQFKATVSVSNIAAAAYPGGDPVTFSVTNATPAVPTTVTLPAIGANASTSFDVTGLTLNAGAASSVFTANIAAFGASRNGTYSPVSSNGQTTVDATTTATLTITPDTAVSFGALKLGQNSVAGNLNVKSNTSYQVDVYDNDPTTAWHLTEWTGAAYKTPSPFKLTETLSIVYATTTVTAGTPAKLVAGTVAGQNGDLGQNWPLTYVQALHVADPLLPAGETYHIVLTFNGYVTL